MVGSPDCIPDYLVDDHLGGIDGLAAARAALAARGIGLILECGPHHVAPDHSWLTERPELFVGGTRDELNGEPRSFQRIRSRVVANGRDPFLPAWPDVVQPNVFEPRLRATVIDTLCAIAHQCDGVRCDMAMLSGARTDGSESPPRCAERGGRMCHLTWQKGATFVEDDIGRRYANGSVIAAGR